MCWTDGRPGVPLPPAEPNIDFVGSIPALYDEFLGPVLFTRYADDLTSRIRSRVKAGRLLETACGTGLVTRRLDRALPPEVRIVATDLSEAMLGYANTKTPPSARLEWRTADAAALPFLEASFDGLLNQFGWMFVPDKALAFREARRVLKGRGALAFNVWGTMEENPFSLIAHATIASFFTSNPPAFYQVPFGYNDRTLLEGHMREAGFTDISLEPVKQELRADSARGFARGLVEGNPVVAAIREAGVPVGDVVDAVTRVLAKEGGEAPFRSTMVALVGTAQAG
ncbi:MAG TPA: class I SAM-dependent methyltransferase [Gemmatimonadales bacterium]|nr:class I SAM-dependent methyltransferase [Gemmatimonadales bacterium]